MEASHHAIRTFTLIVLNEGYRMSEDWGYLLVELPLGEGFKEITTRIFEYAWLDDQNAIYGGFNYVHVFFLSIFVIIDFSTGSRLPKRLF